MFNTKDDRRVVEISIEVNTTAIVDWLESGGKFEDIDKIKREEDGVWRDAITQKYTFDMLPIGKTSNAYYHRNKNLISQNISGIDYLGNIKKEGNLFFKKSGIECIEWNMWRGSLLVMIQDKESRLIIFATPVLTEVVELETKGKLNNPGGFSSEEQKIKVTTSLKEDGTPKECMDIWRWSGHYQCVLYSNALCKVFFSVRNSEVEY